MTISVYRIATEFQRDSLNFVRYLLIVICVTNISFGQTNDVNPKKEDSHSFELTQANNLQRQELIQNICDEYFSDTEHTLDGVPDDQLQHLLIDERHKFLYCYVPKVSSITFCIIFYFCVI